MRLISGVGTPGRGGAAFVPICIVLHHAYRFASQSARVVRRKDCSQCPDFLGPEELPGLHGCLFDGGDARDMIAVVVGGRGRGRMRQDRQGEE